MCFFLRLVIIGVLVAGLCEYSSAVVYAEESKTGDPSLFIEGAPVQQSMVEGDSGKFRAQHWIKDNFAGGLEDSSIEYPLPDSTSLSMSGHALIDEGDLAGKFSLKKEKLGYLDIDYSQFRKYYDNVGGVYRRFTTLRFNELDKDLSLDIGHLAIEAGLTLEKLPHLTFLYERQFEEGTKSRLSWTPVKEGSVTRNIGPSWQEIHEVVDTFSIKADHSIAGVNLNGEQRWEIWHAKTEREERNLSTTTTASDKKIRVQDQKPEADLMTTTLKAERWFWQDKVSTSTGYRFAHMTNHEVESIFELNENRVPTNFSNPKQVRDAAAHNIYDSHTWVGSSMFTPWRSFAVIPKFKAEILRRQSDSARPKDTTPVSTGGSPPDGIIDTTDVSNNDDRLTRWGEGVSLRFAGIPHTAIYNDLEFEQVRNWLSEDLQSIAGQSASDTNEVFSREVINYLSKRVWTLGGNFAPWYFLNQTVHLRIRQDDIKYNNIRFTDPGATTARSVFINNQNVGINEVSARTSLRLTQWLQPAFRYQFQESDYYAQGIPDSSIREKSRSLSNIYTFDLILQPRPDLTMMASYSRQTAFTTTPASNSSSTQIPNFNANVGTWLFELGYAPRPELVLTSTLLYSRADNFNDFTNIGLPLGADNARVDLTIGVKYSLNKHISIEPKYAFYHFNANPDAEFGNYNAHMIGLDVSIGWT